ncbi:hypothetical protein ABB37_05268 [Leptomonas pyrrhocoris]|uniref:BRCT domain-containing protein n=1 Tax=Leptomonas pyrrhocoris TaxID=157538 RepID=A0A0N0VEV7_LEPPY|nr:hypothetical protein ABB37_05268 [Leptomonas pyrrhocoris]KPA79428.1 hypothetical protein ABB37_05268 [Leptomonas pyrrhocoris]|eukprot:XP_015657867.1 hypothetical protein ABB37_05268 [Leptomonas pyrrhocoris]
MWGGIDFFVSLEVLMSASIPPAFPPAASTGSSVKQPPEAKSAHFPGNPTIRRLEFSEERRLTPMFVYPNATLFLQVVCSSGNRVHLMTPWSKEDTTTILKSSEWVSFLKDARRVSLVPGTTEYSFASLGIDPDAYVRTVLVVDDASRWSSATALQLIEVQHNREGVEAFHSMELLYALSRCILFSEWLLRYPSSSIASCVALCNTALFAYCRFFFKGDVVDTALMLLVSFHGGRVVKSEEEATYVVVLPPPEREPSSASSSSVSSSTEDSNEGDSDGSGSSSDDDDDDEEEEEEGKRSGNDSVKPPGEETTSTAPPPPSQQVNLTEDPTAPPPASSASPTAQEEKPSTSSVNTPAAAATGQTRTAPLPAWVLVVTPQWVYRCVRALRLVPLVDIDDPGNSGDVGTDVRADEEATNTQGDNDEINAVTAAAHKTRLLLCCLLPPSDARPLIWTTFQSIARQHHYDTACLLFASSDDTSTSASLSEALHLPTAASVLEALTAPSLRDVVEVRLLSATPAAKSAGGGAPPSSARSRGVVVTRAALGTLKVSAASAELGRIALNRCERRRDKEAVFAHLQLIASQFLYSYEFVQRKRMQETHREAGSQTSGPLHASVGIMTEADAEDVADVEKAKEVPATAASPAPLTSTAEDAGSVDAEEWRHHLKNVEGKLLSRHEGSPADTEAERADKKDDAPGSSVQDDGEGRRGEEVSAEQSTASPLTQGASLLHRPPTRPQGANSIFQAAPLFASPLESGAHSLYPLRPFNAMPLSSESLYTSCYIPTTSLTEDQRADFFVELRSYPIFSSRELGNNVVRLPDGVKCEFTSHKAAEDFRRIDYIEFLSLHLPIYPYFGEAADRQEESLLPPPPPPLQPPQQSQHPHEVDSPLQSALSASNTAQQAQSLWTTPETASPESLRRGWAKSTPPSYGHGTDTVGRGSADARRYGSATTTVPPYRAFTKPSDAAFADPPPRKHAREESPTAYRRSPEKRRRRRDEPDAEDERLFASSSSASKLEEGESRRRRQHRDDESLPRRDDRHERHSSSSGSRSRRRDERRDERVRSFADGPSSTHHSSRRGQRESRRRRSLSDSGED